MRKEFGRIIHEQVRKDQNVILVTADVGYQTFEGLKTEFPNNYINVGVAEQFAITFAAGLSIGGKIPIVYGIAPFITGRCYEQIKICLGYENIPVLIVGMGGSYKIEDTGFTHIAEDDIPLMRLIPNMNPFVVIDKPYLQAFLREYFEKPTLTYLRIE